MGNSTATHLWHGVLAPFNTPSPMGSHCPIAKPEQDRFYLGTTRRTHGSGYNTTTGQTWRYETCCWWKSNTGDFSDVCCSWGYGDTPEASQAKAREYIADEGGIEIPKPEDF